MFKGIIIFWFGTIAGIPYGWHLCDGNAGTPNLLRYHVVGAGGSYAVGAETHRFLHSHVSYAPHLHDLKGGTGLTTGIGKHWQTASSNPLISSNYVEHLPPFYAMLLIMKL